MWCLLGGGDNKLGDRCRLRRRGFFWSTVNVLLEMFSNGVGTQQTIFEKPMKGVGVLTLA